MIETAHLFRVLGKELTTLLRSLSSEHWSRATSAPQWDAKDVAAHMLDGDLRRLSSQRDRHVPLPLRPIASQADLVAFLNQLNRSWVEAARRLSANVLIEALELSTGRVADLMESADPLMTGTFPVAWAGESTSSMWLDIAREYTERWHHQDQIREAVGAPALSDTHWLRPVLEASLLSLPHAFREVEAAEGTAISIRVEGESGGHWTLLKHDCWQLTRGSHPAPAASFVSSDLVACRLLLHRLTPHDTARLVRTEGNGSLTAPLLSARAVMV
jgi:uncharacterized protein (TIGR03083 family)